MHTDLQPTTFFIAMDLDSLERRGRKILSKYDLPIKDLQTAAKMYAKIFKELYEQNGYWALNPTYEVAIEHRVIQTLTATD